VVDSRAGGAGDRDEQTEEEGDEEDEEDVPVRVDTGTKCWPAKVREDNSGNGEGGGNKVAVEEEED
jgi:hypothetical protein